MFSKDIQDSYSDLVRVAASTIIDNAENRIKRGYFGTYGGKYVPEVLYAPLHDVEAHFFSLKDDDAFWEEYARLLLCYAGRPTPLHHAKRLSEHLRENTSDGCGADLYIKLEGHVHTGAHKINNAVGQVLLARKMGKTRIIAETGAGQHGVATATACAQLGIECTIYMGSHDAKRQRPNVHLMEMLGAKVAIAEGGQGTLKDAINDAMRDWAKNFSTTHYLIGSVLGPSPFPDLVHCFQSVIGAELVFQCAAINKTPDIVIACVGGGSNAAGIFAPFLFPFSGMLHDYHRTSLHIAEAGGSGAFVGAHATRIASTRSGALTAREAIVHGYKSLFLVDEDGQVASTHSISAGLDYPGVGPLFARLAEEKKLTASSISDEDAISALRCFARHEGLIFALESAHAGALALEKTKKEKKEKMIVVNMSGRGDKDLFIVAPTIDSKAWVSFLHDEAERISKGRMY